MIRNVERHDTEWLKKIAAYMRERQIGIESDPRWLGVLHGALGHQTLALVSVEGNDAGNGGRVNGYLPVALVKSALFGRFLVSLPYVNRAGLHADDEGVEQALIERGCELAERHNVQYLELRHTAEQAGSWTQISEQRNEKVIMELGLAGDEPGLWKQVGAKVRNLVRKGRKNGLEVQWGGVELLESFYDIFAVNMRDLGTPVYPRKLFESVLRAFGGEAELCAVKHAGRAVAAALVLHDQVAGKTFIPSASCLRDANRLSANMWMYYQLLKRAMERGSEVFDFGRTTVGSGTHKFKKQWGATEVGCVWQYHVLRGKIGGMRPDNPSMQRRIELWKKMPVWATRVIGPSIVKGIP